MAAASPRPPAGPSVPDARGPSPSPGSQGCAEAVSPGHAPAGRRLMLRAPGVGQQRGRRAAAPSLSRSRARLLLPECPPRAALLSSPRLCSSQARCLAPSLPLALTRCPPGGFLGARQPASPLCSSRSSFLPALAATAHPPVQAPPPGYRWAPPQRSSGKGKEPLWPSWRSKRWSQRTSNWHPLTLSRDDWGVDGGVLQSGL